MWTKLMAFGDVHRHRIQILVLVWMLGSWMVSLPALRLGLYFLSIHQVSEIVALSSVGQMTSLTRLISFVLDGQGAVYILLHTLTWIEAGVLILEGLLCVKNHEEMEVHRFARSQFLLGFILTIATLGGMAMAIRSLNPNHAIAWIQAVAWLNILLSIARLILPMALWLRLSFSRE